MKNTWLNWQIVCLFNSKIVQIESVDKVNILHDTRNKLHNKWMCVVN